MSKDTLTSAEYATARLSQLPWIEKYRPKNIDDVILSDNLKKKVIQFSESNNIPNLILTGGPGIGKTTTIRCIASKLYGKYYNSCVLELNASDDRGIKSVQGDIINFCRSVKSYKKADVDKYCSQKLVILDEADNMMEKAQHYINNLMEKYKQTVRFAFTCNSSSDIEESIQSRCIILRYMRLNTPQICQRLQEICAIENVNYEKQALNDIAIISRGDMRGSINLLQLVFTKHNKVCVAHVNSICDFPQPVIIKQIFTKCNPKDLSEGMKLIMNLKKAGYSGSDITLGMIYTIKSDLCDDITESIKIKMLEKICDTAYNISKGVDSDLQLAGCLANLSFTNLFETSH